MRCERCGHDIYRGTTCPICGKRNRISQSQEDTYSGSRPMKWYKTLLVVLWFGIIGNVVSAFQYYTGSVYQGFDTILHRAIPMLEFIDNITIFCCIAFSVLGFVVWIGLKNYKSYAPRLLTLMYACNGIFTLLSTLMTNAAIAGYGEDMLYKGNYYLDLEIFSETLTQTSILTCIASLVMVIANHTYFKNRADLFIW